MDQDVEVSATCRKFGIILGAFRTEVEVLAELHLMYPWVNVTRRTNGAGNAILITKDDRTRKLLADFKEVNGKDCAFGPLGNRAKKAYIMMGVPACVTEELLLQDKEVIEASRMTKWNTEKKKAEPTNLVKIVLAGKQHPVRFTRGYGRFRLRPFVSRPLQRFNCQKFGHQARTCRSEAQTCRYCAGRHESAQCKDSESRTLKCVNCGQGHAATSGLCPKMMEAESKVKSAHKVSATKQVNGIPAPIPLKNAWTALAVQEVGRKPSTQQVTTIRDPMEVSTKSQQSVRKSKPHQTRKPEPVKVVAAPQPASNAWTRPLVPSMMEFPVAMSANRSLPGPLAKQDPPAGKPQAMRQENEEQIEELLETIQIALTGATSLLRKISAVNTRLVPALKKIMEAAMDAINTLTL